MPAIQDERISSAPLHTTYQNRHWIPGDRLQSLREQFPNLKTDKWTRAEKKRLKRNWKHIKKHYPDYSDPKFAFGFGHDNESRWTSEEVKSKRQDYLKFNIMLRMAYRLDDRLICDIYMKCRKMFYDKSFYFNCRANIPDELEKRVKLDLRMNESPQIIAHKYNISPSVVDTISRRPKRCKRMRWDKEAIKDLRESLESIHNIDDVDNLPAREVNWSRVRAQMQALGYELTEEQCYNKWVRLNPRSLKRRYEIVNN
jgi:hypothetical protein